MDEPGKMVVSVILIALGAFLIVLTLLLGFFDLQAVFWPGVALCGFGSFIFYLRRVSISSQSRVKKAKVTRVVREVPKPKPKPEPAEVVEEKPEEPDIMCNTCQYYDKYNPRQKCRFLTDKDRMDMINAGIECVEYKIKLSLLD